MGTKTKAMEFENNENRGFTYIPNWMCELGLRSSELITYAVIYGYTMRCGSYTGSLAFLAKRACLTKQGVIKVLSRLTELGHITRRQIGIQKRYGTAQYAYFALVNGELPKIRQDANEGDRERCSQDRSTESNASVNRVYPINKEINIKQNKVLPSPSNDGTAKSKAKRVTLAGDGESTEGGKDHSSSKEDSSKGRDEGEQAKLEAEFEELWKLYPRKQGRSEARRAYIFARRHGETMQRVKEGLEAYLRRIEREGTLPRFVKQGGNWFVYHRWADGDTPVSERRQTGGEKPVNRALNYSQRHYTKEYLKSCGISFEIDDDDDE